MAQKISRWQLFQLFAGMLFGIWFFFLDGGYWLIDNWLGVIIGLGVLFMGLAFLVFFGAILITRSANKANRARHRDYR